jgi:hypothetical protein
MANKNFTLQENMQTPYIVYTVNLMSLNPQMKVEKVLFVKDEDENTVKLCSMDKLFFYSLDKRKNFITRNLNEAIEKRRQVLLGICQKKIDELKELNSSLFQKQEDFVVEL